MPTATAYVNDSIGTAGPAQLVLALYDGALGAIERARILLEAAPASPPASVETVHTQLLKAQRIVAELNVTLDHDRGGDIAANLAGLYDFCLRYLVEANLTKDPAKQKSTRLNSSHVAISYAVFCLKKKKKQASRASSSSSTEREISPEMKREDTCQS